MYMQNARRKKIRLGDPLMVFFEHIKSSNLRLWDMFSQLDKDKSLTISRDEFRNGMKVRQCSFVFLDLVLFFSL